MKKKIKYFYPVLDLIFIYVYCWGKLKNIRFEWRPTGGIRTRVQPRVDDRIVSAPGRDGFNERRGGCSQRRHETCYFLAIAYTSLVNSE